uniref:Glutathione synthetase n=1 Tax=Acanthochromis polyacanthus TaxID=80966 RepID=A0A3Q1EE96_9TELE
MTTKEFLQQLITNPEQLSNLVEEAIEMAFQQGFLFRTCETPNSSEVVTYAPFTLFPSAVPKARLVQALEVQTHFNTLVDKISQDPDFLEEALASTIQADDFTARLVSIYRQVQQEGQTQSIVVGLNRSDYMVEQSMDGTSSLKQVEINTIAAAGFGVLDRLPEVHRHILRTTGLLKESECVQDTNMTPAMAAALAKAWEVYGQKNRKLIGNIFNMKKSLFLCRNIPVIRRKFEEVSRRGSLDGDKRLFIDGLEVAVVYYRYGYMPDNYTEQSWAARLLMERSRAVKCPDIGTQLAGTKKIQQVLASPGVLEKFFPDQPQVVEQIRATGLYTLDMGPEGDQTVAMALTNPHKFVLKPQREGGGNNYYGEDIVQVLQKFKNDQRRAAYILMDKIQPRTEQNIPLRKGLPPRLTTVSYEIGVFGAYVRYREMILNEALGPVLRTKSIEHDDAGVVRGVAMFDSPLVV